MNLFDHVNQNAETIDNTINLPESSFMKGVQERKAQRNEAFSTIPSFQVDLTDNEKATILKVMAGSETPDIDKEKWEQAILFSKQFNIPLEGAYTNLDALVEYQTGQKPVYTLTGTKAIVNSFEIGQLTVERAKLAEQYYFAERSGDDTSPLVSQIQAMDAQIESLADYKPRNWAMELLKGAANTIAYSAEVAKGGIIGGAAGNAIALATGYNPIGTILSTAGSFIQGYRLSKYSAYYDMVQNGVDKGVANWTSTLSGTIQAAIESVFSIEAGLGRITAGGSANFVTAMMKNLYTSGTMNTIAYMASTWVTNGASEGIEELLQSITDSVFTNLAYTESGMDAPKDTKQIFSEAFEEGLMGLGVGLLLGVGNTITETLSVTGGKITYDKDGKATGNLGYAKSLKADAIATPSKETFISDHMEDEQLSTLSEKKRKQALSETYDSINAQFEEAQQKAMTNAEARTIETDYIEQADNVGEELEDGTQVEAETSSELPPIKRLENGRLKVAEANEVITNSDGSERHRLLIGSADSTNRYGTVTYTINTDGTISIDSVKTRSGFSDITKDAVMELQRSYPGYDISWDPETKFQQDIKADIISNSPTGKFNWFEEVSDSQERAAVSEKIGNAFTNLNRNERDIAAILMQMRAEAKGMKTSEYLDQFIEDMKNEKLGTVNGSSILGKTDFSKGIKAVIYAGEKANFSTFSHETFHVIRREMSQAENQRLVSAFKSAVDTDQFKKFVEANQKVMHMTYEEAKAVVDSMGEDKWTRDQEELAATMFEAYLREGKTSNSKLANIFSRIADFFRKIYGILRNAGTLNQEIRDAYDSLFERSEQSQTKTINEGEDTLFQTQDAEEILKEDARSMDLDEFIDFMTFMGDGDMTETEIIEFWNRAHGMNLEGKGRILPAITEGMTDIEKDEEFIRFFKDDEAIKSLMERMRTAYSVRKDVNRRGIGANSQEEYDLIINDLNTLDRFMREVSPFMRNVVKGTRDLTPKTIASIRTMIENNPRMYRDLYAEIVGDPNFKASVYDEYLPGIDDEGWNEIDGLSIAERRKLSDRIENEELKKKILFGKETYDGSAEKLIRQMDEEIEKLNKDLEKAQQYSNDYYNRLNADEKKLVDLSNEEKDLKRRLDREIKNLNSKIASDKKLSQEDISRRNSIKEKLDAIHEQITSLRASDKAAATLKRQEAIKDLKSQIAEKQRQRREAKRIHDFKQNLANAITREIPNSVDYEYRQKIEAIQAMIDPNFRRQTIVFNGRVMSIEEFRKQFRSNFEGVSNEELDAEVRKAYEDFGLTRKQAERLTQKNLNDFTVEELEDLAQTVADLKEEGKQVWQAKQDEKKRQTKRLQDQIMREIMLSPKYKDPADEPMPGTAEDKKAQKSIRKMINAGWLKTLNMDRKAQMIDGDTKGVAYDLLMRRKREVQNTESKRKAARFDPIAKKMEELGIKPMDIYETVPVTLNGKVHNFTYSDLYYGLAAQNEERNFRAFAYGTLVSRAEKDSLRNDNQMIEALGKAKNKQFVEQAKLAFVGKENLMEIFKAIEEDLQAHSSELAELMITEYDTVPDFQRYYLPIYRADFNGTKLAAEIDEENKRQSTSKNAALPKMGMTKNRIDISANNQKPVHLDYFSTWQESVEQTEHLIATLGYERDLKRVFQNFGSDSLRSMIEANFGRAMVQDIDNHINEIGNPPVYHDVQGTEKTIRYLRGNLYSAYLGFKASGIVLQGITSPAATLGYVSPFRLAQNLVRMTFQYNKTFEFVSSMSEFMKNRSMDPALDIVKMASQDYTDSKVKQKYSRFLQIGTMGLEAIDKWAVTASWMALYQTKLEELGNTMDAENMKKAAAYADEIIVETQPVSDPTELAPLYKSRSELAKAVMQFTTSMNIIWNNVTYDIPQAFKKKQFKTAVGMIAGYALAGFVLGAVQNGNGDEDDKEDVVRKSIYDMTTQFTGSVPLVGSIVDNAVSRGVTGNYSFYGSSSLFPWVEDTLKGLGDMGAAFQVSDIEERRTRLNKVAGKIVKGVGLAAGLPTSAISELKDTFIDENGFTFNPGALLGRD